MEPLSYLVVMALCLVVTLPLEWAFDARVYRRPARTIRALWPVVVVFYLWDVMAIARNHWFFADAYVTGVVLPLGVPLEELVFFIVIPLCALLSFESVRNLLGHQVGWFESLRSRLATAGSIRDGA
jgi:lycopene beta-cyclase